MKSIFVLVYLAIHTAGTLWAQEEGHVFYYPLNVGDLWEYRRSPGFLVTREVIGDTMLANDKSYRILKEVAPEGTSTFFQRVSDSSEVFQFYERLERPNQHVPDEFLLYKLDIQIGDSWKFPIFPTGNDSMTFQVVQLADTTLFSKTLKFANLFVPEGFQMNLFIADSIGIFVEESEGQRSELQGAIIDNQQFGIITSVRSINNSPRENNDFFFNNYPNPFNSSTTIEYRLSKSARVRISIFNVLGERVRLLTDAFQTPGMHRVNWFGNNESRRSISSGIYFYTIEINARAIAIKNMLFLK